VVYRYSPVAGGARIETSGTFEGPWPMLLPRIALVMTLPKEYDRVSWFGRGPGQNYRDSKTASLVGRYTLPVEAMHTDYARPQDNGLRTDVRSATFHRTGGPSLRCAFDGIGDLQAHRYTTRDLMEATHACDLVRRDQLTVHLGHKHLGLGSHSCGPMMHESDMLTPEPFAFAVTLTRVEENA
jgi:beta-galactosidase/evolved beta-galactosidase subunit alpha